MKFPAKADTTYVLVFSLSIEIVMHVSQINRTYGTKELRVLYGWSYYVWKNRIKVLDLHLKRNQRVLSIAEVVVIVNYYGFTPNWRF